MRKLLTIEQIKEYFSDSEIKAINKINGSINNEVCLVFGRKKQYIPVQINVNPTIDELATIAFNYQTYIVTNPDIRGDIMYNVDFNNLQNWTETLEPAQQYHL